MCIMMIGLEIMVGLIVIDNLSRPPTLTAVRGWVLTLVVFIGSESVTLVGIRKVELFEKFFN